jgi:hypothetical protein
MLLLFLSILLSDVDSSKASGDAAVTIFSFLSVTLVARSEPSLPFAHSFSVSLLLDVTVVVVSSPLACMTRTHPISFFFAFASPSVASMQALHSAPTVQEVLHGYAEEDTITVCMESPSTEIPSNEHCPSREPVRDATAVAPTHNGCTHTGDTKERKAAPAHMQYAVCRVLVILQKAGRKRPPRTRSCHLAP